MEAAQGSSPAEELEESSSLCWRCGGVSGGVCGGLVNS